MLKKFIMIASAFSVIALAGCSAAKENTSNQSPVSASAPTTTASAQETTNAASNDKTTTTAASDKDNKNLDFDKLYPQEDVRSYAKTMIGTQAPEFEMTNMNGNIVKLSDYKGQNVIVEVAQTTCSACMETQRNLKSFHTDHPDVAMLQVFPVAEKADVLGFLKATQTEDATLENILTNESGNTFIRDYRPNWTPTIYFIDKNGKIAFLFVGSVDKEMISDMLKIAYE